MDLVTALSIMSPLLQLGFALFAFLSMTFVFWFAIQLLGAFKENTHVMAGLVQQLNERPCQIEIDPDKEIDPDDEGRFDRDSADA